MKIRTEKGEAVLALAEKTRIEIGSIASSISIKEISSISFRERLIQEYSRMSN